MNQATYAMRKQALADADDYVKRIIEDHPLKTSLTEAFTGQAEKKWLPYHRQNLALDTAEWLLQELNLEDEPVMPEDLDAPEDGATPHSGIFAWVGDFPPSNAKLGDHWDGPDGYKVLTKDGWEPELDDDDDPVMRTLDFGDERLKSSVVVAGVAAWRQGAWIHVTAVHRDFHFSIKEGDRGYKQFDAYLKDHQR